MAGHSDDSISIAAMGQFHLEEPSKTLVDAIADLLDCAVKQVSRQRASSSNPPYRFNNDSCPTELSSISDVSTPWRNHTNLHYTLYYISLHIHVHTLDIFETMLPSFKIVFVYKTLPTLGYFYFALASAF